MKSRVVSTIRGQVYELLKEGICAGEYQPGQWLLEGELAEQFSVSRSPVREALRRLAADGLVVEVPNKGVFVREFTPKDIEEIFDLRVMMESYAIDKIAEHLTEEMASQLYGCLEELKSAWNLRNLPAYIEADTQLHDLIIAFSGNSFLVIAYERVHIMIQQSALFPSLARSALTNPWKSTKALWTTLYKDARRRPNDQQPALEARHGTDQKISL